MSKLLVSGNGKTFYPAAIVNFILAIGSIIAGFVMINMANSSYRNESIYIIIAICGFIGGAVLFLQAFIAFSKARTKVNVYESGIDGCGIEKNPFSAQDFKLTYDQISNIDVLNNIAIVIYTPYTKYTCYTTKNTENVRKTILDYIAKKEVN